MVSMGSTATRSGRGRTGRACRPKNQVLRRYVCDSDRSGGDGGQGEEVLDGIRWGDRGLGKDGVVCTLGLSRGFITCRGEGPLRPV